MALSGNCVLKKIPVGVLGAMGKLPRARLCIAQRVFGGDADGGVGAALWRYLAA